MSLKNAYSQPEYLPFGETLIEEHLNSYNSPFRFNAKELDEETGNYYYGARYYNPKWSIWLSVDPMSEKYPGWSPYNYTLQNPIKYIDPDGNDPIYGKNFWGNLKLIGDDGKDNGRVYFVTGKVKRGVKRSTKNGDFYTGSLNGNKASSVPTNIKNDVVNSVNETKASQKENGGHIMKGAKSAVRWDQGPEPKLFNAEGGGQGLRGSVKPFITNGEYNPPEDFSNIDTYWHVHPDLIKGDLHLGDSNPSDYNGTGDIPTQRDYESRGFKGNPFVIGVKDGKVKFYNGNGTIMTIKYEQFLKTLNNSNTKR